MRPLALVLALFLAGCCWWARRDCFPQCDPPQLVEVAKPCSLPPPVVLEPFRRTECADPKSICYSVGEAAKIAENIDALKTWIMRARARCGNSAPASRPN
jgi:hypothetical protein